MINNDVTFGVSCVGNVEALQMCLASVLQGKLLPCTIVVRFEGPMPSFGTFYMEQLSDLARFKGVEFVMTVAKSKGIRAARDWLLEICATKYLWMGDDDVIYDPECLSNFEFVTSAGEEFAYLCGTKADVNNRRGWKDFNTKVHSHEDVREDCSFNHHYDKKKCFGLTARIHGMDTGNCLINLSAIRGKKIRFQMFDESTNCGGEDTLFALACNHAGLTAYFVPSAQSFHLEKPRINFGEDAARAEMVMRAIESKRWGMASKQLAKKSLFPWLWCI
jgi:hypothetical protein